jgi:heptosyltransferase-2
MNNMKILVIRLKQIGDAVLALPVCKSLRKTWPDAEIHYLLYEHIAPLFTHSPAIDKVQVFTADERAHPVQYLKKVLELRKEKYDLVIDVMAVPVTVFTTRLTGARWQIGFDTGKWRSRLYKSRVPHPGHLGSLDGKLKLLDALPVPAEITRDMSLTLLPAEVKIMRTKMTECGIDPDIPVILFSTICQRRAQNWPSKYFVELIDYCLENYPVQAVLIHGPGEQAEVQEIASGIDLQERVFSNITTAPLRDLALLARNSLLLIGNDSGPRHVAESAGTPTFAIFSPTASKHGWHPNPGDDHIAIDMCDLLQINMEQWHEKLPDFADKMEDYYRLMTPELILEKLDPMLKRLIWEQKKPG